MRRKLICVEFPCGLLKNKSAGLNINVFFSGDYFVKAGEKSTSILFISAFISVHHR